MWAKVATMDMGRERLGTRVAEGLGRNRKMTNTTRTRTRTRVDSTSSTEFLMDSERSKSTFRETEAGSRARKEGNSFRTAAATSTVLVPGWRWKIGRASGRGRV